MTKPPTPNKPSEILSEAELLEIEKCPIGAPYKHIADLLASHRALSERLAIAEEALESIASEHRPRHNTEEYWMGFSHEHVATVVVVDTKIAREALKCMRGET